MTPVSRNEPRDQLAAIIGKGIDRSPTAAWLILPGPMNLAPGLANVAAAAAIAAGWRPPPRILKTDAELATVVRGTVVHAKDGTIACRYDAERGVVFGDERPFPWSLLRAPATVLWSPEEPK